MANHYRRCKDCGADRNDGAYISKTGRCPKCGEARQVEWARRAREALESGRTSPDIAPNNGKPAVIRVAVIDEPRVFPVMDDSDA